MGNSLSISVLMSKVKDGDHYGSVPVSINEDDVVVDVCMNDQVDEKSNMLNMEATDMNKSRDKMDTAIDNA
ncbi:MAG: hypothetical protein K0U52_07415 [Gammaproteobacteria bacterium]|nr:hypothetical protein [Gammaproteobacteria bacterium]